LKEALEQLDIGPIATMAPLYRAFTNNNDLIKGEISTQWLERWLSEGKVIGAA
jgi:acetyl-CoA carboxylase biotin carboxylase subunit